ncbi:MAG: hypothetical protein DHS20C14_17070 [Phycisphaeraceae bacterium]|nr:MAG: hypothetical protein DHS20C14_17070 [Phycisphaeraceae bacterium]
MQDPSTPIETSAPAASGGTPEPAGSGELLAQIYAWAERIWFLELFEIDDTTVKVSTLVVALLVLVIGLIIAKRVSRYVGRRVLPRLRLETGPAAAVQSILHYAMVVLVAMLALQMAGMPLTVFTIFGGALALGIGFGSQNIVNNFMSGLILLIERPIAVGQLVEVEGLSGSVTKIGARATVITGYRGTDYIVPNSKLLENPVANWNLTNRLVRSEVEVGVAYGSETQLVRTLMLQAVESLGGVDTSRKPMVLFQSFGDSALVFVVSYWTQPASTQARLVLESDLRFEIDRLFREADVVIAFPQQDMHLDTLKPLEVRVMTGG